MLHFKLEYAIILVGEKMLFKLFSFVFIFSVGLFGQQNDLSLWTRSTAGSMSAIPWYMHIGDKLVVDVRHNYDAKDTAGLCLGRKYGGESISFVPEACGYVGKIDGLGPELLVFGGKGRVSLFSQNQYVFDSHRKESYVYHWVDLLVRTNKHFHFGVDWQAFKPTSFQSSTAVDVGPTVKIVHGHIYFRVWPAWAVDPTDSARRGNPTLFLGVGYVW